MPGQLPFPDDTGRPLRTVAAVATWQELLICRYGRTARSVLGWYDTLTVDEQEAMTAPLLAGLCNAVMLVPVLAEITGRSREALLIEQVSLAVPPHRDRLLAWLAEL